MIKRYGKPCDPSVATAVGSSVNLLFNSICARLLSSTFEQPQGDWATSWGPLAHHQSLRLADHHLAPTMGRRQRPGAKENLIVYNQDDCEALEIVTTEVLDLIEHSRSRGDVDLPDEPKVPQTQRAAEIHADLKRVLRSACSDYWKARIKIRGGSQCSPNIPAQEKPERAAKTFKLPRITGRIIHVPRKRKCQRHPDHPTMLRPQVKLAEQVILDLAFTKTGCRQTVVRYVGRKARCPHCNQTYTPPGVKSVPNQLYGKGLHAWIAYTRVALRLS